MKVFNMIASVRAITSESDKIRANKHGVLPLVLDPIAGKSPRGINLMDGTAAENSGVEADNVYAFKVTEHEPGDERFNDKVEVRQFDFQKQIKLTEEKALDYMMNSQDVVVLIKSEEDNYWEVPEEPKAKKTKKKAKKAKKAEVIDEVD